MRRIAFLNHIDDIIRDTRPTCQADSAIQNQAINECMEYWGVADYKQGCLGCGYIVSGAVFWCMGQPYCCHACAEFYGERYV